MLAAFAGGPAIAGHNWSPFLRGAGGRGFAPSLGVLGVQALAGMRVMLGGLVAGPARAGNRPRWCSSRMPHSCR